MIIYYRLLQLFMNYFIIYYNSCTILLDRSIIYLKLLIEIN